MKDAAFLALKLSEKMYRACETKPPKSPFTYIVTKESNNLLSVKLCLPNDNLHCVKSVQSQSFSGPYFQIFPLNVEIHEFNPHIHSKFEEIQAWKKYESWHFLRNVD